VHHLEVQGFILLILVVYTFCSWSDIWIPLAN